MQPLQAAWYNDIVERELRLPDFGRPDALAVVIGNNLALWQPFLQTVRGDARLRECEHPIERYTMDVVNCAVVAVEERSEVRWAHTVGDGVVAMQRLAQIAGTAYLSPAHLSIHPRFGPWIALRAVIVVDVPGPPGPAPVMEPPCGECEVGCMAALRAVESLPAEKQTWRRWVEVRDACPLGREFRYSGAQIEYHYTKDREILSRKLSTRRRSRRTKSTPFQGDLGG